MGWHHEWRVRGVENLIGEIDLKMVEQISLRLCMQIQARLIQQQYSVLRMASVRVSRERDVEGEEPLKTSAPVVEVNLYVVGARWIRDDCVEVVCVEVESNFERAILPQPLNLTRDNSTGTVRELVPRFVIVLPV
ncbi:hypothetical protein D3C86_1517970 [compost metagenome]